MPTAMSIREDAIRRLCEIADRGYDLDNTPRLLTSRRTSLLVLHRQALSAAAGDPARLAEIDDLWPICQGQTEALVDAKINGLPEPPDPTPKTTIADLEEALLGNRS